MQQKNQDKMEFERELLFFASYIKVANMWAVHSSANLRYVQNFVQSTVLWLQKSEAVCIYLTPSTMILEID